METERTHRYIGIARKAGKLLIGTPAVCDGLRRGDGDSVFASCDISEGTKKRLSDKCSYYGATLHILPTDGAALAHMIGKTGSVAAVMITDPGLASAARSAAAATVAEDADAGIK